MNFLNKLSQFQKTLVTNGFTEEAELLLRVCHYIPEDTDDVPSFWRRNYDYGEGFYFGDMSKKPGVKEWRKKHKNKGPNFSKKKRKSKKKKS